MRRTILALLPFLAFLFSTNILYAAPPTKASDKPEYPMEVLFAPVGGIKDKLANLIQGAEESIDIAAYNIYLPDVTLSLTGAKYKGIKIRIIMDNYGPTVEYSDFPLFKRNGIPLRMMSGTADNGAMNHSFAIIDGKLLAMGSYRWSETGENGDYSSMIFTADPDAIKTYQRKFDELWGMAGSPP